MSPEYEKIVQSVKMRQFAPVYLVDGEESFYIDKISDLFQDAILSPAEKDFNLTVLYGKDASWQDVLNACNRFPMFSERQVVILKDAAQLRGGEEDMKGLNALIPYIEKPSPHTVFLIEHPFKKVDGKTKFAKRIKDKGVHFTSEKLKDEHIPGWISEFGNSIGFKIARQEAEILASALGSDLKKIANEVEKIRINVPEEPQLSLELIRKYIGISKEYNVFDFPKVLTSHDQEKMYKMLSWFIANTRSAPMPLLIGTLYGHFSKLYTLHFLKHLPPKQIKASGIWDAETLLGQIDNWPLARVEHCLLLLAEYNTMAVGINSSAGDKELLKEMIGKMIA